MSNALCRWAQGFFIVLISATASFAAIYNDYQGNGALGPYSTPGAVGNGSLRITDNGYWFDMTFHNGSPSNPFSDNLVIFIDTDVGSRTTHGFTTTSGFHDRQNWATTAVSGVGFGGQQSVLNFAPGFQANLALVLQASGTYALFHLANGGDGSLSSIADPIVRTASINGSAYSVQFTYDELGMSGHRFGFESNLTQENGARTFESFQQFGPGSTSGWGGTLNFSTYDIFPVPETTNTALAVFGVLACTAGCISRVRRSLRQRSKNLAS